LHGQDVNAAAFGTSPEKKSDFVTHSIPTAITGRGFRGIVNVSREGTMAKKRYALIGTGSRSNMYIDALFREFSEYGELVALCDTNQKRMDYYNGRIQSEYGHSALPTYKPESFEKMLSDNKPDTVIVTSIDRTHHRYIIKSMVAGCDVISEKPMTIDAEKCREIYRTIEKTGRSLKVTFNYRYAPRNSKVKELLAEGVIGKVKSVHFEWLLDTSHGADYFRRWHRDKRNSGGLMVHKATHHFDLVNWWLDAAPVSVFGRGDLAFYGRENAEQRGVTSFYTRSTGNPAAADDPFALSLKDGLLEDLYLNAESEDGYIRDQSVFGDGISIEDDMSLIVSYDSGATMTYHLCAYSPWEGFRIAFNGTEGRLEYIVEESSYVSGSGDDINSPERRHKSTAENEAQIIVRPQWKEPYEVEVPTGATGGHGGGDIRMLRQIFVGDEPDTLGKAADHRAGAKSILVGIAANASFRLNRPVTMKELVEEIDLT
jgi:predicted dehydrogenase